MSTDELKFKVISRLLNGETPREIDKTMEGVSYPTILRWNRELTEAQENGTVEQLVDLDRALLGEVLAEVAARAPDVLEQQVAGVAENITKVKSTIEVFQSELVVTAKILNLRVRSLAHQVDNSGELSMLADTLCTLQTAFFNKNQTQVNVQNNYDSSNRKYSTFLEDKPHE